MRIFQIISSIPVGKVATYGQIARLAGMPKHARLVGHTLRNLPKGSKLPWHRVVNAQLRISNPNSAVVQKRKLKSEGVKFDGTRILGHHRWETA